MMADLNSIGNALRCHYAPFLWKKQHTGWELDAQLDVAENAIMQKNLPVAEYQKIVRRFFRSMQDYHCSVRFHSTELSVLPFQLVAAGDRYFVVDLNGNRISSSRYTLKEGDELLTINDRPIHEVVLEIQKEEFGTSELGTDRALATIFVTRRLGSAGSYVPNGQVRISVLPEGTTRSKSLQLNWLHRPELITHNFMEQQTEESEWDRMMITPLYEELSQIDLLDKQESAKYHLGARDGFLPNLSNKLLWKTDDDHSFRAYVFELEGKKVGYVRIPNYLGNETLAEEFAEVIKRLQNSSDCLVIDQLNNPGGSVFYLYALASMLTDRPLETPKHSLTLTPREIEFAVNTIPALQGIKSSSQARESLGDTMSGYPVSLKVAQNLLKFCNFLVGEWESNRLLSHPTFLFGVDQIDPHPKVNYTKPILMLINELDFSGGDFMPAILQDNKRAVLMGSRTAGAGGFVAKSSFPNRFGIDYFFYTASIAHRLNQNPIENLGVTPDVFYSMQPRDIQEDYRFYKEEILKQVRSL